MFGKQTITWTPCLFDPVVSEQDLNQSALAPISSQSFFVLLSDSHQTQYLSEAKSIYTNTNLRRINKLITESLYLN